MFFLYNTTLGMKMQISVMCVHTMYKISYMSLCTYSPSCPPLFATLSSSQAHRAGYRYPAYMFLTYAWYPPQWWARNSTENSTIDCTPEDRLEVLEHTLAFLHFPFVRFGAVNDSTDVQLVSIYTCLHSAYMKDRSECTCSILSL